MTPSHKHSYSDKDSFSIQGFLAKKPTVRRLIIPCMTLGNRIKERRTTLGLSQDSLATLMSVSRESVRLWEAGINSPSRKKIADLARHLQTTPQELEFGLDQPSARQISPQAQVVGALWERLPEKRQREIFAQLVIESEAPSDEYVGYFLNMVQKKP
jgi:transcriptional regulator with XRE-family HTH domain